MTVNDLVIFRFDRLSEPMAKFAVLKAVFSRPESAISRVDLVRTWYGVGVDLNLASP